MKTVEINDIPLSTLLEDIKKGDPIALMSQQKIVATIIPTTQKTAGLLGRSMSKSCYDDPDEVDARPKDPNLPPRQPGNLKGIWMSPDFDEPLEDFKEYME